MAFELPMMFSGRNCSSSAAEPQVLRLQVLPLEGLDAARLDVVGDHAGDDPQKPGTSLQAARAVARAGRPTACRLLRCPGDGDAEKAAVGLVALAAAVNAVGKARFLGNAREIAAWPV